MLRMENQKIQSVYGLSDKGLKCFRITCDSKNVLIRIGKDLHRKTKKKKKWKYKDII